MIYLSCLTAQRLKVTDKNKAEALNLYLVANSHRQLFKCNCKLTDIKYGEQFNFSLGLVTYQGSDSHMWLVATIQNIPIVLKRSIGQHCRKLWFHVWHEELSIILSRPFFSAGLLSLPQRLPLSEFNVLSDLLHLHGLATLMFLRLEGFLKVSFNNNDNNS